MECGNFSIFCIFRFYMKSILWIVGVLKRPFCLFKEVWILILINLCNFWGLKFTKNGNSVPLKLQKWQIFIFQNSKIWFHVKSEVQKNTKNFHTVWNEYLRFPDQNYQMIWQNLQMSKIRIEIANFWLISRKIAKITGIGHKWDFTILNRIEM